MYETITQTLNLSLRPQGRDLAQWEMVKVEQSLQVMSKQERLENWTARIMTCRQLFSRGDLTLTIIPPLTGILKKTQLLFNNSITI